MTDLARRTANLVFALTLFPASSFSTWSGIGQPLGETTPAAGFSPEIPAGYAFAIWGVIFGLNVIYAVRQALPGYGTSDLYRRIGWATAAAALLNTVWMLLAQTIGNGWWLVVIIFGILVAALNGFLRTNAAWPALDRFDRWITLPMTALLAGWLSAAVWLNASSLLRMLDPNLAGVGSGTFALTVLALATVLSWTVLVRAGGSIWYAGTTIWALAGIIVANVTNTAGDPLVAGVAAIIAAATVLIAILAARRGRRTTPLSGATGPSAV